MYDQLVAVAGANYEALEHEGWALVEAIKLVPAGEQDRPADEVFEEVANKHGLGVR